MRILAPVIYYLFLIFFNQKTDSPHGTEFKISCKTCHSSDGWQLDKKIYSFDHDKTRLPLSGQHSLVNCRQCHTTLVFSEAKTECVGCHQDMHQSTAGLDCSRCHTPFSWLVTNIIDIHQRSRFPLLGAHRTADCSDCHNSESGIRYDVAGVNCIDCHLGNFMSATNPNHSEAGFSKDCANCHSMNSFEWAGSGFNHNVFPLVLGHAGHRCDECHATTKFNDASPDCISCHQQAFLGTTNPNHSTSGFSTACQACHSLNPGWKPATFNHNNFPLTLGHSAVTCAQCHPGGNYTSTQTDCNSCHNTDYNNAVNPNHKTSGFSTICTQCHTTNPGWKPAAYTQHDNQFFPIYSGRHRGTWTLCSDCHTNPANYAQFTCVTCHKNSHPGHSYTSAQCLSCHPRGQGD